MNSEPITNQPPINPPPNNVGVSPSSLFEQIYNGAFGTMKWFVGLRWYVILCIVVFGSYLFFQMEYAIETRRISRELKRGETKKKITEDDDEPTDQKEGMNKKEGMASYNRVDKIKGILRQNNIEHTKKRVSFYNENTSSNTVNPISQIYNWWILPWAYVLFRSIGIHIH